MREKFMNYVKENIQREGIDKLMSFLAKSDFFTAPASTKYHLSYEGGLLEHSLHVYEALKAKKDAVGTVWAEKLKDVSDESIAIVALFHDICKTYYYDTYTHRKKVDDVWQDVTDYCVNDRIPYGHGEKSVMMVEEYMKLLPMERYAIRWHMGPYSGEKDWNTLSAAMEKYPLVLALFEADMEATYVLEVSKEEK